jgi:hypothetical protein
VDSIALTGLAATPFETFCLKQGILKIYVAAEGMLLLIVMHGFVQTLLYCLALPLGTVQSSHAVLWLVVM